ncbi:MAG TPA: cation diffusion facilitator family transporter [Prosthecobacter sp.]
MSNNLVAIKAVTLSMAVNAALAVVKVTAGILGHSYALIADGIESVSDIFVSLMVLVGLKVAEKPADENHPYGHGRAEQLAGLFSALSLLVAGGAIAWQSIHNIMHRHTSPAWFTLPVLVVVILVKESLSRFALKKGDETTSTALKGDAWHHRADAITSGAALVGISVALIGGDGYEMADDVAALVGCLVIFMNGTHLLREAVHENMDGAANDELYREAREIGAQVPGVCMIEKLRMKKSGLGYHMDIHVQVDGTLTVAEGHRIGHEVQRALLASDRRFMDVIVHVEPYGHQEEHGQS